MQEMFQNVMKSYKEFSSDEEEEDTVQYQERAPRPPERFHSLAPHAARKKHKFSKNARLPERDERNWPLPSLPYTKQMYGAKGRVALTAMLESEDRHPLRHPQHQYIPKHHSPEHGTRSTHPNEHSSDEEGTNSSYLGIQFVKQRDNPSKDSVRKKTSTDGQKYKHLKKHE